jgi:putative addiction module component (TIGR02574 family)
MNQLTNELTNKVLSLSVEDRVIIAQRIWDSIESFVNVEIEKIWLDEAEKRWMEIEGGKVKCISADEVMQTARKILQNEY